jgi:glycosyltransferase involved in cell wall biosynthesis
LFSNNNILLISPEPWDGISVSKHHYAIELSKRGNTVFFLNPPNREQQQAIAITKVADYNIWKVDYKVLLRGARFLPSFVRIFFERRFLRKLEQIVRKKIDVVWNFENSRFFDLRFAGKHVVKIYHQVDLNQNFNPKLAAETADIVFAVNEPICKSLIAFTPKVYKIPHGYHPPDAGIQNHKAFEKWKSYGERNNLIAVYVGNLDSFYLDNQLFQNLIRSNPQVRFVLVGPYETNNSLYQEFRSSSHVHFTGRLSFSEIASFLDAADVLLILYRSDEFPEYVATSHKVLEYLASGKVIVSSFMQDYTAHKDLLVMANKNADIPDLFRDVTQNIDAYNKDELMAKRKVFALNNTYSMQLNRIVEKIKENNLHL